MGRPRSTCAVGLRAAATAGAAAADNTLLRISWEGWQVVGWQIAVSRTTRAYREEVACCGAATSTLRPAQRVPSGVMGTRSSARRRCNVGRAACQRSLPSSRITEQDIGRAAAKQYSPWRVSRRVPSAADDAADERESRPCAVLAFVSRILLPWAGWRSKRYEGCLRIVQTTV